MRLDHVGIAAESASDAADLFAGLFDAPIAHRETFDGLRVVFVDLGGTDDAAGPYLELLEPVDDGGAIARFLDREGPGIHHIAVAVPDATAALETASALGIGLVDDEPRPGAWGHTVAFLHPDDTGGVLVEFVEH